MDTAPTPRSARTDEWADAFRLVFGALAPDERERRVANALNLVSLGELDPKGIFVLRGPAEMLGALVCLPVPGASALVWPPGIAGREGGGKRPSSPSTLEDCLVHHAVGWLRQRGVKLAQSLLAPEEAFLAAPLERNGFAHVTNLWYMRHGLELSARHLDTPVRLDFDTVADNPLFGPTLLRTYEQTLDCPEVSGVRTLEEVLEGHRAQGRYDPDRWWLARLGTDPVGVLIVAEMPETGDWEVAYMGVVPEARRRGFGRELLLHALTEARAAGVPRVTLSVDARNLPAWELYRGLGFEPCEMRVVHLAVWR
jgi:mycothiol synthase